MCISFVSNNFYPLDAKPRSVISTVVIITALVSAVMVGISLYSKWNHYAIAASVISFTASLITEAVLLASRCYSPYHFDHRIYGKQEEIDPQERVQTPVVQLHNALKRGDLSAFGGTLHNNEEVTQETLLERTIFLGKDDEMILLPNNFSTSIGYSLLELTLMLKDNKNKKEFAESCFLLLGVHEVSLEVEYLQGLLEIQDPEFINLALNRLSADSLKILVPLMFDHSEDCAKWIALFLEQRNGDVVLKKQCSVDQLIEFIVASHLTDKLNMIRRLRDISLERLQIKCLRVAKHLPYLQKHHCNLLHLAIEYEDVALVAELIKYPILLEQPTFFNDVEFLPIHRAVMVGNTQIVSLLLGEGANPHAQLKDPSHLIFTLQDASQFTPLMIAEIKQDTEIIAILKDWDSIVPSDETDDPLIELSFAH